MPFAASYLVTEAEYILNDAANVRWTEAELLDWVNDAVEQLLAYRPEAFGDELVVELEAGAEQPLASTVVTVFEIPYNVFVDVPQ